MNISLKQLELFVALAKTSNMTRASENVHLTQSACSMSLASLENQLGGELFDRIGKKLMLNERGETLLPKIANIVSQLRELKDITLRKNPDLLSGHISVGASTTIGNYVMPEVINSFMKNFPRIQVTLRIDNTEQIIKQLLKFEIDVAFIEGNCSSDKIRISEYRKDELIIIASPKHPLTKKRKINLSDLQQAQWILRESGSGTREKFEEAIHGKIKHFIEMGHTEAIKHAVMHNMGIACLSKYTVVDLLKNKRVRELKTSFLKLTRNFYMLLHKDKHKTDSLKAFIHS